MLGQRWSIILQPQMMVNVTSKMESQGRPGKIQISLDLYDLLDDEFICERRGVIDVMGNGLMETWRLTGRKPRSDR